MDGWFFFLKKKKQQRRIGRIENWKLPIENPSCFCPDKKDGEDEQKHTGDEIDKSVTRHLKN